MECLGFFLCLPVISHMYPLVSQPLVLLSWLSMAIGKTEAGKIPTSGQGKTLGTFFFLHFFKIHVTAGPEVCSPNYL